jgi:hypothetical protein
MARLVVEARGTAAEGPGHPIQPLAPHAAAPLHRRRPARADPLDDARAVEPDRCVRHVVQVADPAAEQDRHQVDTDLVDQAGVETPLGEVGAAERHDPFACMGLGLGDRLLDAALGDERERRVRTWPAVGDRVPHHECARPAGVAVPALGSSNVRRPTTRAPTRAQVSVSSSALALETRKLDSDPSGIRTGVSPRAYQVKTSATPSAGSATNPSSDTDMLATTRAIVSPSPASRMLGWPG